MKSFQHIGIFALFFFGVMGCSEEDAPSKEQNSLKPEATRWADMTLYVVRNASPNSPTYTSRSLGYLGLTMYETVVHGNANQRSLVGQLNGLNALPLPEEGKDYNWTLSLNAGQSFMLQQLYGEHAFSYALDSIAALEEKILEEEMLTTSPEIAERSKQYGIQVATLIYEWSVTDGGFEGFKYHWDPSYIFPDGPGYWTPPTGGQTVSSYPLHPHWGNNRTFLKENSLLPVPQKLAYSTSPTSEYYKLFHDVYKKRRLLTQSEKNIAAWWADDPTQTASPPGHSYNLATISLRSVSANNFTAAEVYAKVGMAVADAFINCWKCKYTYHSERPFPYIKSNIDPDYTQFWPEPPFPAFSSGHATQSAAAAIAMISVFGDNFRVIDDTYQGRFQDFPGISYKTRIFNNIWETAEECAHSRFLGGIHTQHDNEAGTEQGILIGQNVINLLWQKQ